MPPRRINEIVLGKRAITADTDLRLARYAHIALMALFFLLHWYDFGAAKTLVLFGTTIFLIGPIIFGIALARIEVYFREAWWGWCSLLVYPVAIWLAFSFTWFGAF